MDKLKMQSNNLVDANVEKIARLFPNSITETTEDGKIVKKVDFDLLRQELSNILVEGKDERYRLDWAGKRQAILTANSPISKTLRPCREESINFDTTENLYIEGDNLDALKLLHETYLNKVKMIYIDPPYNTGTDLVYNDSFATDTEAYLTNSNQKDDQGKRLTSNTDSSGRYHSDWLSMMYMRLRLARDLLREDGIIFISIDDNEQANLKKVCDEIFGSNNFIGNAGRITKKSNNKGDFWAPNFDYILTYAKNRETADPFLGGINEEAYNLIEEEGPRKGEHYQLVRLYMSTIENRNPEQRFWIDCPDGSKIIPPGSTLPPERPVLGDGIWRWTRKKFEAERDKIVVKQVRSSNLIDENGQPAKWNVFTKTYLNDVIEGATAKPNSFIESFINQMASHELNALGIPFDYAKPTELIKFLIEICKVKDDDIVLDFFSGSASTAHAIFKVNCDGKNRKFVMIQLPEQIDEKKEEYKFLQSINRPTLITELGKERIRRAGKKIAEENLMTAPSLDIGFRVLKLSDSNMKDVYYNPNQYNQSMLLGLDSSIKEDRTEEDILFQVMLDKGVSLSSKIEKKTTTNGQQTFYIVGETGFGIIDLICCLDKKVNTEAVKEIAKLNPECCVFLDSGIENDATRTNIQQIFDTYSPKTKVEVL